MKSYFKRLFKWSTPKVYEFKQNQKSYLLVAYIGLLEEILFWKTMWLSVAFIFILNLIFLVCVHQQINFMSFVFCFSALIVIFDAFETWLKYKHRTTCLKRLASYEGTHLTGVFTEINNWIKQKCLEFIQLRDINHTKAFILVNILLGIFFVIANYISGYILIYIMCMSICLFNKVSPPITRICKKIQQNAESDVEFEGLIPEVSELNIKLLSIEPEHNQVVDEKQSFDYWKPEDVPLEETSDSSDNSSSLVTNLSIEKMNTLGKHIDTSDSSDDEYIPSENQKEKLRLTLKEVQPAGTWSSSAYNALYNLTGAVANIMYSSSSEKKRKRVTSIDSSDGFEMIDKNELN